MQQFIQNINVEFKSNTVVEGKIVDINKHFVTVDIGFKTQGKINTSEFTTLNEQPSIGDTIEVYISNLENRHGAILLSRLKAKKEMAWMKILEKYNSNQNVKGTILKPQSKDKGQIRGYTVVLEDGIHAFLPESHIDTTAINLVNEENGNTVTELIEFKILKLIKNYRNILVSRKMIFQTTDSEEKNKFLEKIKQPGSVITGIIKNITEYGVFVDLKYIDGLLHISDISWKKIHHPREVIHESEKGRPITVKVIKYDQEKQKVHLGLKQLTDNPWHTISKQIKIGDKMNLKVANIKDKEGQVIFDIKEYLEGVMPKEEISWDYTKQSAKTSFNIGQEVEVMVYHIDNENEKILVSKRRLLENPWKNFIKTHNEGSKVSGTIHKINNYDFIIDLNYKDLYAYLPFKNLSWNGHGKTLVSQYSIGNKVEAIIKHADIEDGRIILSIKDLSSDPYEKLFIKYSKNSEIEFTITRVTSQNIYGKLVDSLAESMEENNIIICVPRQEQHWNISEFKAGEKIKALVLEPNRDDHMIIVSIKNYQERLKSEIQNNKKAKNIIK